MGENLDLELEEIKDRGRRKKKSRFELITTQLIVCVVVLLAAFILKMVGGTVYGQVRQSYIENFEDHTRVGEVLDTFSNAFGEPEDSNAESPLPSDSMVDETSDSNPQSSSDPLALDENLQDSDPEDTFNDNTTSKDSQDGAEYVASDLEGKTIVESIGSYVNSIMMPVNGRIRSGYGYRVNPVTGKYKMHGGIDIGGYEGEPILAAMAGKVVTVAEDDSFGKYIVLEHANGMKTLYAHCSKIISKEGDQVDKGSTIAQVGSTGESDGPHCHFEIRVNNVRINPLWILPSVNNT